MRVQVRSAMKVWRSSAVIEIGYKGGRVGLGRWINETFDAAESVTKINAVLFVNVRYSFANNGIPLNDECAAHGRIDDVDFVA